jgi:hypothetical protein
MVRHAVLVAVAIAAFIVAAGAACDGRGGLSASTPGTAANTRELGEASPKQVGGEQKVAGDFYEVLLKWTPSGADPRVREWLEGQGLTTMSMKAGILTIASPRQIDKSFGVSVEGVQPPFELPVPEELRSCVSSITVLKPRSYH